MRSAICVAIPLWLVVSVYVELHPGDAFYLKEFNKVLLRAAPPSAKVVGKSASLFSLRNEYCAYSRIEISPKDYMMLLSEVENDPRFTVGNGVETQDQSDVWHENGYIGASRSFERKKLESLWVDYAVFFLKDGRHVEINSCVN